MKLVGYTHSVGLPKTTSVPTAGPGIRNSFRFHDLFELSRLIFGFDFFVVVFRFCFQSVFFFSFPLFLVCNNYCYTQHGFSFIVS